MKPITPLLVMLVCQFTSFAQVGIGTTMPNSKALLDLTSQTKGLLVPRMTSAQKLGLGLTSEHFGMMIYQTDVPAPPLATPKGLYVYDGTSWMAPLLNGVSNGQTLRWDGNKWTAATNLFNQGSSIGINTTSPNTQLHVHSSSSASRIQVTDGSGNSSAKDGLLIGITNPNAGFYYASIMQVEKNSLGIGTDSIERIRIDSIGNVGINTAHPTTKLDVNGNIKSTSLDVLGNIKGTSLDVSGVVNAASFNTTGPIKVGTAGTAVTGIIRYSAMIDLPLMLLNGENLTYVQIPGVMPGATVQISPADPISVVICYARVSAIGTVEIKFMNMTALADPAPVMYYITVIQ